jgi:hypothetical protein
MKTGPWSAAKADIPPPDEGRDGKASLHPPYHLSLAVDAGVTEGLMPQMEGKAG